MVARRHQTASSKRWLQVLLCAPLAACTVVLAPWDDLSDGTETCETCGEDACVDLQIDEDHCGACDHGCETGTTCGDGRCEPVRFLSDLSQPGPILSQGGILYVVEQIHDDSARLFRVDRSATDPNACLTSGDDAMLAPGCVAEEASCCFMHRSGETFGPNVPAAEIPSLAYFTKEQRLLWSERTGRVCNIRENNDDPCLIVDGGTIEGIAVGGDGADESVFWANTATGSIARRRIFGTTTTAFVSGVTPRWIATAPEGVYFTDGDDIRFKLYDDEANVSDVRIGAGSVNALATTATHLYWTSDTGVYRLPHAASASTAADVLSDARADFISAYDALEGAIVYWTARGDGCPLVGDATAHDGQVVRWREKDHSLLIVATGQPCAGQVTVDDTLVYWTTSESQTTHQTGAVWRLRR